MKLLCSKRLHDGPLWKVSWQSGKQAICASCSQDQTIVISKIDAECTPLTKLTGAHQKTIRSLDFSPDGNLLAAASFDGTVSIWLTNNKNNSNTVKCITMLEGHENEVKDVAFSPSGQILATCGRDRTIWLWKLHSEEDDDAPATDEFEVLAILQEHQQDVKSISWDIYNLSDLISVSYDESALVWSQVDLEDEGDWRCVQKLEPPDFGTVWAIAFTLYPLASLEEAPKHKLLFLSGEKGKIAVYSKAEKRWAPLTLLQEAHHGAIYALDSIFYKDRILLVSCGQDRVAKLWLLQNDSLTFLDSFQTSFELNSCKFKYTESELYLALGDDDGQLHVLLIN